MSKTVKDKSFAFALRVANLYKYLISEQKEFVLSKQLLRSGTSVGAMVREAEYAETSKDFIHKMAIARKEAGETMYWLELLKETEYLSEKLFNSIYTDATELIKMLTSIIKTTKANNQK